MLERHSQLEEAGAVTIEHGPETYDESMTAYPYVLKTSSKLIMFYNGTAGKTGRHAQRSQIYKSKSLYINNLKQPTGKQ